MFDFLGNPTAEDLAAFEAYVSTELEKLSLRQVSTKSTMTRLKLLKNKLIIEGESRGLTLPTDLGAEGEPTTIGFQSEKNFYDGSAAKKMLEAKGPFIEGIKVNYENLESLLKRTYYAITKEEEKLLTLQKTREELLEALNSAKTVIRDASLLRKPEDK